MRVVILHQALLFSENPPHCPWAYLVHGDEGPTLGDELRLVQEQFRGSLWGPQPPSQVLAPRCVPGLLHVIGESACCLWPCGLRGRQARLSQGVLNNVVMQFFKPRASRPTHLCRFR